MTSDLSAKLVENDGAQIQDDMSSMDESIKMRNTSFLFKKMGSVRRKKTHFSYRKQ